MPPWWYDGGGCASPAKLPNGAGHAFGADFEAARANPQAGRTDRMGASAHCPDEDRRSATRSSYPHRPIGNPGRFQDAPDHIAL
jgi:hypothetical protein